MTISLQDLAQEFCMAQPQSDTEALESAVSAWVLCQVYAWSTHPSALYGAQKSGFTPMGTAKGLCTDLLFGFKLDNAMIKRAVAHRMH